MQTSWSDWEKFDAWDYTTAADRCASMTYELSYLPASATANLIELKNSWDEDVKFKASNNTNDANVYTVTIRAKFTGQT